jgi:hypothetical protein
MYYTQIDFATGKVDEKGNSKENDLDKGKISSYRYRNHRNDLLVKNFRKYSWIIILRQK